MSFPAHWVFPLHLRPFGETWLPSPNEPRKVIEAKLAVSHGKKKSFICGSNDWDHRREEYYPGKTVPCDQLAMHYPIVTRTPYRNITYEGLVLNGTEYYKAKVQEKYEPTNDQHWEEYFQT